MTATTDQPHADLLARVEADAAQMRTDRDEVVELLTALSAARQRIDTAAEGLRVALTRPGGPDAKVVDRVRRHLIGDVQVRKDRRGGAVAQ